MSELLPEIPNEMLYSLGAVPQRRRDIENIENSVVYRGSYFEINTPMERRSNGDRIQIRLSSQS